MSEIELINDKQYKNRVGFRDDVRTLCICCKSVEIFYGNSSCGTYQIRNCKLDNTKVDTYGKCKHQKMHEECVNWD